MPRMSHPPLRKCHRSLILCVLAALPALVATTQPASAADGRPYTNPLKSFRGADPWLQYHDGNYYLITTTFTGLTYSASSCQTADYKLGRLELTGTDPLSPASWNSGKCLDVDGGGTADGTDIFQWTCNGGTNQKWRAGDHVRIVSESTGKVADVADCSAANGADVRQWTWLNNNCQQWRLVPTT